MGAGKLAGKLAFITGGSSGIGEETAKLMIADGARVAIADIQEDKGRAVAEQLGDKAIFVHLDVTDEASWQRAIASAEQALGPISIVVNAAGVSVPSTIEDSSYDHWRHVMSINADGVFLGCKHGVAALKRAGGGAIVNLASTLSLRTAPLFPAYSASKAAVRMLTRSTALYCAEAKLNIRCNAVLPGAIDTPMYQSYLEIGVAAGATRAAVEAQYASAHPMGRVGKPEEVAAAIVFLASDDASFTTGIDLPVDGGFLA